MYHGAIGMSLSCFSFVITAILMDRDADTSVYQIVALSFAKIGSGIFYVVFIALQGQIIPKNSAASAFSIIKTMGLAGGIIGPYMIGKMKQEFNSFSIPMYLMACSNLMSALLFFRVRLYLGKQPTLSSVMARKDHVFDDRRDDIEMIESSHILAPLGDEIVDDED